MLAYQLDERTTQRFSSRFSIEDGVTPLTLSDLSSLTLTYYDLSSGGAINGRTDQDVKNLHDVTISVDGLMEWTITPADLLIVSSRVPVNARERHVALFKWTWAGGQAYMEFALDVRNLGKVS